MENYLSKLRLLKYQLLICTIVFWGVAMSIDRTVVEHYREHADDVNAKKAPLMVRNEGNINASIVLSIIETALFGFGMSFILCAGPRVFRIKNKILRVRMIGSWIAISYFCISWWPHSTTHSLIMTSSLDPYDNYITMETSFHWTILAASIVLSYYQFDLMMLMYEVAMMRKTREGFKDPLQREWYHNFKYHAVIIGVLLFGASMAILFKYTPIPTNLKGYQKFFYATFRIFNSFVYALGFAYSYIMIRIINYLPANRGRTVAIISTICIWFNFMVQVPHPLIHAKVKNTMTNYLAVDFGLHIPIIVTTGVLAFYQMRMIELATDKKSSLSIATQMRRGSKRLSQSLNSISGSGISSIDSNKGISLQQMGSSDSNNVSMDINNTDSGIVEIPSTPVNSKPTPDEVSEKKEKEEKEQIEQKVEAEQIIVQSFEMSKENNTYDLIEDSNEPSTPIENDLHHDLYSNTPTTV